MRLPFQEEAAAIALYSGHDASIAVGINGRIQCVLELERLFGQRGLAEHKSTMRALAVGCQLVLVRWLALVATNRKSVSRLWLLSEAVAL